MAYTYRYHLKEPELRNNIKLSSYSKDIKLVINNYYGINLKDCIVKDAYFEFKLYETVTKGMLQEMGRKLKKYLPTMGSKHGFVRMEQTLYALVYPLEYDGDDITHIELIDSILLDNSTQYMDRAKEFFKVGTEDEFPLARFENNVGDAIIRSYYIDVLESYTDRKVVEEIFETTNELRCYFIKAYHRRYNDEEFEKHKYKNNLIELEKCFDSKYVESKNQMRGKSDGKKEYLEIFLIEKKSKEISRFNSNLNIELNSTKKIPDPKGTNGNRNKSKLRKYIFKVHNVGQALTTSLSEEGKDPYLYMDYGVPFGTNKHTKPSNIEMAIKPGTPIILSHVHKDHWFGIVDNFSAYKCNWFIPKQPRKIQLQHVIAEILVNNGNVQVVDKEIDFYGGKLNCGSKSNLKSNRDAKSLHETGLTLRIEGKDINENDFNILIPGDQMYDYTDLNHLKNLDVLVASHHGGNYSWSVKDKVPGPKSIYSTIVYSYGTSNSHGHPSKIVDYFSVNWKREHHTSRSGDYKVAIYL